MCQLKVTIFFNVVKLFSDTEVHPSQMFTCWAWPQFPVCILALLTCIASCISQESSLLFPEYMSIVLPQLSLAGYQFPIVLLSHDVSRHPWIQMISLLYAMQRWFFFKNKILPSWQICVRHSHDRANATFSVFLRSSGSVYRVSMIIFRGTFSIWLRVQRIRHLRRGHCPQVCLVPTLSSRVLQLSRYR